MTGFRLSWRIEPSPLGVSTNEVGRTLQTPGFQKANFDTTSYLASQDFKASLLIPEKIMEQVGNGSLVVQLEVYIRGDSQFHEDVVFTTNLTKWGPKKYKLYREARSWADAEAHCRSEGVHLASVSSGRLKELAVTVANGKDVWLGGRDMEGAWSWSDGSVWNYTNWEAGHPKKGKNDNCVKMSSICVRPTFVSLMETQA